MMDFPAEIISKRFGENVRAVRNGPREVMLEVLPAHMPHELRQFRNAGDRAVAEGVERVVCEFAFADIGADAAFRIGGGDASERQPSGRRATIERAVGVLDADDAAEDGGGGDFYGGQK